MPIVRPRTLFEKIWPPLPVWKRLDAAVLVVILYTIAVEVIAQALPTKPPKWIGELGVVNAVLLGVLLGFRNMQAYDRWWEARKLWGQLINDTRNLFLKSVALAAPDAAARQELGRLVTGFAVALKLHLRGIKKLNAVVGFEHESADPDHVPLHLAGRVYALLNGWRASGRIDGMTYLALDPHAKALMDVSGACERIQSSPVPLSYRALLRHGTILYLISAPWFLTGEYGYWAVAVVGLLAYFLLGTELTAEDVEEPFGRDGDDLELAKYCDTIRRAAEQTLGIELPVAGGSVATDKTKNPPAK